jgi:hypothetical protein
MDQTQAVQMYDRMADPLDAIDKIGQFIARSGMFGCQREEQGKVLAATAMMEKKSLVQINRTYHLIEGNLSMRAEAMLANFRAAGGKHKIISRTPEQASIELTMGDQTQAFALTWEEAQKEPFVYGKEKQFKKNWATPRARMQTMWARVVSDGVRVMAPEIVCGVYTPEEIEDTTTATVEPKQVLQSKPQSRQEAKPEPKQEADTTKVIDVQSEPLQPSQTVNVTPVQTATVTSTRFEAVADAEGKPTVETLQALGEVLQPIWDQALPWLIARKALPEGATQIHGISFKWAKQILDRPQHFVNAVTGK